MSSEIYYDKAFIRIEDKYIPIANHGSSNCFEFDSRGREIPEKQWTVLNYPYSDKLIFSKEAIQEIADAYEKINMNNRGGIRKSRNRSFEEGEFGRWILAGIKNAHTVEEYREFGNTVMIVDYDKDCRERHCVLTTEELLKKLEEFAGRSITISFLNNRSVTHPPIRNKKTPTDFTALPKYYVLKSERGYFVKRSSRRIWFAMYQKPDAILVRKFKTENAARKYLESNQKILAKYNFNIECVKNKNGAE